MLVIGINGSPRKGWNTSTLVSDALEGASSAGADTEMVDLYDHLYSGCRSCFGCKRVGVEDHKCYVKDDLTGVLDRCRQADALVIGSPVYFGQVTADLAAFLERFLYPYSTYSLDPQTFCPKKVPTAFIYTMNVGQDGMESMRPAFGRYETIAGRLLGEEPKHHYALDTWQYSDYDRYMHSVFDVESKRVQREEVFPKDREACREMGARLVSRVLS